MISCTAIVPYREFSEILSYQKSEKKAHFLLGNLKALISQICQQSRSFCSSSLARRTIVALSRQDQLVIMSERLDRVFSLYCRGLKVASLAISRDLLAFLSENQRPFPHLNDLFPIPSALPYHIPSKPLLEKRIHTLFVNQVKAFFHHCILYTVNPSSLRGNVLYAYLLDIREKNIRWQNDPLTNDKYLEVARIKVEPLLESTVPVILSLQKWTFSVRNNPQSPWEERIFWLERNRIISSRHLPVAYLNGSEFEIEYSRSQTHHLPIPKKEEWDTWKETYPSIRDYRGIIFPMVRRAFDRICASSSRDITVMDIGGGDGEVALSLLDRHSCIKSLTIVEISHTLVELANQRRLCNCPFYSKSTKERLTVFEADVTKSDLTLFTRGKKIDVINLCGVVTQSVLSLENSRRLLIQCRSLLNEGGVVLISGMAHPYFNSVDYQEMGFQIKNKSFLRASSPVGSNPDSYTYLYLLQKQD